MLRFCLFMSVESLHLWRKTGAATCGCAHLCLLRFQARLLFGNLCIELRTLAILAVGSGLDFLARLKVVVTAEPQQRLLRLRADVGVAAHSPLRRAGCG